MYPKSPDIASLISSRICHDLASPLGAITNGLELMELSGVASSPEFALLSDSVENASARINFFRFAFGPSGNGVLVGENEIRSTVDRYYGESRIKVIWAVQGDIPRPRVKLALLTLSCL
jgi:histidine phosphotransferase ChpT